MLIQCLVPRALGVLADGEAAIINIYNPQMWSRVECLFCAWQSAFDVGDFEVERRVVLPKGD